MAVRVTWSPDPQLPLAGRVVSNSVSQWVVPAHRDSWLSTTASTGTLSSATLGITEGKKMLWVRFKARRAFFFLLLVALGAVLITMFVINPQFRIQCHPGISSIRQDSLALPAYHDDLLGVHHEQPNVSKYLKCVDPEMASGIQDLLCMSRPKLLDNYKNPCFVDWTIHPQRLRCMPYFHVLGVDKCGTTDLHSRLVKHPHILPNNGGLGKETYYWCWNKYGQWMRTIKSVATFSKYLRFFEAPTTAIVSNSNPTGFHPLITGDGTPMDFWDFRAWTLIPQNWGLPEPVVLTPHLMRHLYADPKFIIILRNPVDRLYSDYIFLGYGFTPEKFRDDVPKAVAMMENCMKVNTTRQCVFSNHTYVNLPMRIHIGMYSVFMREWLSVFPRSMFYILRTEDYHANMTYHLTQLYQFLNVEPLPDHLMKENVEADRRHETKAKKKVADMYPETRAILQKFYSRYNEELAVMLDDARYLWMDT